MNVRRVILDTYRAERGVPFAWGSTDCLGFAAKCAQAIIGRDPIAHIRGRYDSETSARRVMVTEGWRDMGDVAASAFVEIPPAMARSGDWAHVVQEGRDGVGVVVGEMVAVKSQDGVGQVPFAQVKRAFRVE